MIWVAHHIATTIIAIVFGSLIILGLIGEHFGGDPKSAKVPDRTTEGIKRTGRVGLWVTLWPVGLWRSVKHGQKKRDERLAKMINDKK